MPILLVFILAETFVVERSSNAADECIRKPNAPAPQGSHWYYRTDRTSNRQCWYLGEESAKARASERQAVTSAPDSAPKRILQPLSENRDGVVEPAVSGAAEKSPGVAVASIEWQPLPSSASSTGDTALQRNADEHSTVTSGDDLPVKSPTPSPANQPAANEPVQHAIGFGALIAVLGVALSISILVYRIVRLTAFRSKLCDSQTPAPELANVAEQPPPYFAPTVATNVQTGQVQNWMAAQSDQDGEIEVSVRRLLQELQQRYRVLHGHDFKPTSESSAPPSYGR